MHTSAKMAIIILPLFKLDNIIFNFIIGGVFMFYTVKILAKTHL